MLNSPLLNPLHEYVCPLSLNLPQFCCSGRHSFGKYPWCSPYSLQVIKSFLPLLFGLAVSFGSTSTKRQTQFLGNKTSSSGCVLWPCANISTSISVQLLVPLNECWDWSWKSQSSTLIFLYWYTECYSASIYIYMWPLQVAVSSSLSCCKEYMGWGFPGGTVVKNPPANAGDTGLSPGPGRSHMPRSN